MSEISKITISGDLTYDIKDSAARELINGVTTSLNSLTTSLSTMAFQPDAPSDDKQYGRQNGDWVEIQSSTTYTLPIATSTELGGVKIGEGLSIDNNGVVSVSTESGGGDGYTHIVSSVDLEEGVSILPENTIYLYYEVEE